MTPGAEEKMPSALSLIATFFNGRQTLTLPILGLGASLATQTTHIHNTHCKVALLDKHYTHYRHLVVGLFVFKFLSLLLKKFAFILIEGDHAELYKAFVVFLIHMVFVI